MTRPVYPCDPRFRITQEFGVNRRAYAPFGLLGHDGIDIGTPTGSNIYSVLDGVVVRTQEKKTGYGRLIVIQHDGFLAYYGHLKSFMVSAGDSVQAGDVIGLSGGGLEDSYRGNSTGAHLHFEIRPAGVSAGNGYAGAVDPFAYLLDRFYPAANWIGTVNAWIGLNVRSEPNTSGYIVNKLRKGVQVGVWDIKNGWARLRSLRSEYVSAKYLDLQETKKQDAPKDSAAAPETDPLEMGEREFRMWVVERLSE